MLLSGDLSEMQKSKIKNQKKEKRRKGSMTGGMQSRTQGCFQIM
jgi:hypothetical protein